MEPVVPVCWPGLSMQGIWAPMDTVDALTLANTAIRLHLVQPHHVQEAWDEIGERGGADPEPFLKVMERKGHLTPWQSGKLLKGETGGYLLGHLRTRVPGRRSALRPSGCRQSAPQEVGRQQAHHRPVRARRPHGHVA